MNRRTIFLPLILLSACQTNPYPTQGVITVDKPLTAKEVLPAYSVGVPDVLYFTEGQESTYPIELRVPAPGQAVISAAGLPEGAVLDSQSGKIRWTPGFQAANDSNNLARKQRSYEVTLSLRSSEDPITNVRRTIVLVVHDSPRNFKLNGAVQWTVNENEKATSPYVIESEDFPQGPFEVIAEGLPSWAKIERDATQPTLFSVVVSPEGDVAKTRGREWENWPRFDIILHILTPDRGDYRNSLAIYVQDVRQKPLVVSSSKVQSGRSVSVPLVAFDPNLEIRPKLTLTKTPLNLPGVQFLTDPGTAPYTSTAELRVVDLPPSYLGTKLDFTVTACVYQRTMQDLDLCTERTLTVQVKESTLAPPVISRVNWPLGKTVYAKQGQSTFVPMTITDPMGGSTEPTVTISPSNLASQIHWKNGELEIKTTSTGILTFRLDVLSNVTQLKTSEGFVLESFASTRPQTLLAALTKKDPESIAVQKALTQVDWIDPEFQILDSRVLADRKALVVTSEVLANEESYRSIWQAWSSVSTLVISAPNVADVGGPLKGWLEDSLAYFDKSWTQLGLPPIQQVNLRFYASTKQLALAGAVNLKGTFTPHSKDPMTFALYPLGSNCSPIIMAEVQGKLPIPLALECVKKNQKLILLGFEWGDLQFSGAQDEAAATKWLRKMWETE